MQAAVDGQGIAGEGIGDGDIEDAGNFGCDLDVAVRVGEGEAGGGDEARGRDHGIGVAVNAVGDVDQRVRARGTECPVELQAAGVEGHVRPGGLCVRRRADDTGRHVEPLGRHADGVVEAPDAGARGRERTRGGAVDEVAGGNVDIAQAIGDDLRDGLTKDGIGSERIRGVGQGRPGQAGVGGDVGACAEGGGAAVGSGDLAGAEVDGTAVDGIDRDGADVHGAGGRGIAFEHLPPVDAAIDRLPGAAAGGADVNRVRVGRINGDGADAAGEVLEGARDGTERNRSRAGVEPLRGRRGVGHEGDARSTSRSGSGGTGCSGRGERSRGSPCPPGDRKLEPRSSDVRDHEGVVVTSITKVGDGDRLAVHKRIRGGD